MLSHYDSHVVNVQLTNRLSENETIDIQECKISLQLLYVSSVPRCTAPQACPYACAGA